MLLSDFSQMENKTKADKEQFLRGMQLVFSADDSRNTMMGMQVALQINAELNRMEEQGVDVDRAAVMNAFKGRLPRRQHRLRLDVGGQHPVPHHL